MHTRNNHRGQLFGRSVGLCRLLVAVVCLGVGIILSLIATGAYLVHMQGYLCIASKLIKLCRSKDTLHYFKNGSDSHF